MKISFYMELNGDYLPHVYKLKVITWGEAKKEAIKKGLKPGDVIASCKPDSIETKIDCHGKKNQAINKEKCILYATLKRGLWINLKRYGGEGAQRRDDIYYYTDVPDEYLDADGFPYDFDIIRKEIKIKKQEEKEKNTSNKFYRQSNDGNITDVYKIEEAISWKDVKRRVADYLPVGDIIAECEPDAIAEVWEYLNGHPYGHPDKFLIKEKCTKYAILKRGVEVDLGEYGGKGKQCRNDIYYYTDAPSEYLDADGFPYDFEKIKKEIEKQKEEKNIMNKTNYYMELNGDVTSQVYRLNATTWQSAKEEAWDQLQPGDSVAECTDDAIKLIHEDQFRNEYYDLIIDKCVKYVTKQCGEWVDLEEYGGKGEDFREDIYYWDNEKEFEDEYEYLGEDGKPYDFDIIRREIEKQKKEEEEEEKEEE